MARLLAMPEVAANATEAMLLEWAVLPAGRFRAGEVIATIETDKANVDVEADHDGTLVRALVDPGSTVAVGAPIALLGVGDEAVEDPDAALARLGVGGAEEPVGVVAEASDPVTEAPAVVTAASPARLFASPLARRLARDADVALEQVRGTGPGGRVRKCDVLAAIAARADVMAEADAEVPDARTPAVAVAAPGQDYDEVPHTRLRRAVADRLTGSMQSAPHFYVRGCARVDALLALRAEINADDAVDAGRVSINDLVVRAVAVAHRRHPEMNVTWTADAVRRHHRVDVAVAVATERGLLTPVVRDVDRRSLREVALDVRDLASRAAAGRLRQEELEGGCVTVSNLGMHGTEEFSAIINPPHASILAVGAVHPEVVAVDGEAVVAHVLRVVLSVDHRPVDGELAARWMRTFVDLLEHPARILA